jgi:hypothetical protein
MAGPNNKGQQISTLTSFSTSFLSSSSTLYSLPYQGNQHLSKPWQPQSIRWQYGASGGILAAFVEKGGRDTRNLSELIKKITAK